MELTPLQRTLISRATALVLGLALLYGGVRCFNKSRELRAEWRQRQAQQRRPITRFNRDSSGSPHVMLLAILLLGGGGVVTLLAVVPTRWLFRIPVSPPTGRQW